jgi:hypothetical protein
MKKIYLVQYNEGYYEDTEVHTLFATELKWLADSFVSEFNRQREILLDDEYTEREFVVAVDGFADRIKVKDYISDLSESFVNEVEFRVV